MEVMAAPVFELDEVTVTRGSGATHSHPLSQVTLTIGTGRCTAIVGPSGAGKSTLLRLLNRLEEPSTGTVRYRGAPIATYDVLSLRRQVGLVQQRPVLLGDTVLDDLRVADPALAEQAATHLLAEVDLPVEFLHRETPGLSGGEGQRVCLARAVAVRPEVLLADEPTSALDAFAANAVEQVLRGLLDRGLTLVLVCHDLRQARRLADDVVVVVAGRVVDAGPAARVLDEPSSSEARAFLAGVS
ncbi:MAG TPA: ATP-binding cassette domain-containing protein [Mycobacteriales bacterium]|nr:ATP-binding cassette domain-containing protein [Mycobacteriales bacterium]